MNWEHFYLLCFATGFIFSVVGFLLGSFHWHLPHWIDALDGHINHPHVGHAAGHAHHPHVSFLNPSTIAAFLAWFGGAGYLLTRFSTFWGVAQLAIALTSGVFGAAIIYLFLSRVLISKNENLDSATYKMIGVLGRTSVPIREGGTGEIIYSQAGTRRTCGARAEDGSIIPKGSEVVVTRYEKGIAYVRLWMDVIDDRHKADPN